MKFWQKVFLSVLVVSVIAFNIGIYIMIHVTYKEQLNSMKQRAIGEMYFLRNSISKDFVNIEASTTLTRDVKKNIYDSYASYYAKQNVFLEMFRGTSIIGGYFNDDLKSRAELELDQKTQNLLIREYEGTRYLILACHLEEPYEDHTLVTAYPLTELQKSRSQLVKVVILVDILMTIALSGILYLVIRRLMKPLKQLSEATKEIADGKFEQRVGIHTQDEFGSLAVKFNVMVDKIEQTVQLLREESEQKQRLVDNLAHELRTPLTSISGYAEYMRMASLSQEERIYALDYVITESNRLEKLSKTLLMIADIREGELQREKISVECLEKSLENLFYLQLKEKNIELIMKNDTKVIEGNEALVQCLLSNLIENGIRACNEGGQITVSFKNDKDGYCILVEDNGIGMEPEEIAKIMEPFYRIDKARSRKQGGVGLGVTLCTQIIQLHKGSLIYESEVGKGTRVQINI